MSKPQQVFVTRRVGRFNWAGERDEACWSISISGVEGCPFRVVETFVDVGGRHDNEGEDDPIEIAAMIRRRERDFLFSTRREERLAAVDWIEANEALVRLIWLRGKERQAVKDAEALSATITSLRDEIAELEAEALASA